jgi:hypothetical protein
MENVGYWRSVTDNFYRKLSTDDNIQADVKAEEPELKATDLPALAAKDELRGLGYLADDQNLLFGNAAPTVFVPPQEIYGVDN